MARKAECDARCGEDRCYGMGVYRLEGGCGNCGWQGSVMITRGHEAPQDCQCPRCGCERVQTMALGKA